MLEAPFPRRSLAKKCYEVAADGDRYKRYEFYAVREMHFVRTIEWVCVVNAHLMRKNPKGWCADGVRADPVESGR